MVFLAQSSDGTSQTKKEIAGAEGISVLYTGQILLKLKKAGLVNSRRGPGGGFVVARNPGTMTVGDVLRTVDGPIRLAPCDEDQCSRGAMCVTRRVWDRATSALEGIMNATTIGELADETKKNQAFAFQI